MAEQLTRERIEQMFSKINYDIVAASPMELVKLRDLALRAIEQNSAVDLRHEVMKFAVAMEERLRANDHKGGWQHCDLEYLFHRLAEEHEELKNNPSLHEAADVANFAMMIAQNSAAQVRVPASGIASTGSDPTPASAEPESVVLLTRDMIRDAINKHPLIASLLYDIDLLPEQIKGGDERREGYLYAVVDHMLHAMRFIESEQQATTRGKPETVSDTAPVPAVSG